MKPKVKIALIEGVEGNSLSVCEPYGAPAVRVAGPKPWGGGRVLKTWEVDTARLIQEIEAYSYSHPKKFTEDQDVEATNWADSTSPFHGVIVRRVSDKTVIFARTRGGSEARCKIHRDEEGNEHIYPMGRYSMCPVFYAP